MDRMSGIDAGFWYIHSSTPMFVGAVIEIGTNSSGSDLEIGDLRGLVSQRADLLSPLRKIVWMPPFGIGFPRWVDAGLPDLDFHVREYSNGIDSIEDIEAVAGGFLAEQIDPQYPAWQLMLAHRNGGGSYLLAKVHHALLDGQMGLELLAGLLDITEDVSDPPEGREIYEEMARPDGLESLVLSAVDLLTRRIPAALNLRRRIREVSRGADDPSAVSAEPVRPFSAARCELSGSISKLREVKVGSLELSSLAAVSRSLECTINEALLVTVAGGLRRYLIERGWDSIDSLVALVPISIRSEVSVSESRNRLSGMLVRIAASEKDRASRARETIGAARSARRLVNSFGPDVVLELAEIIASPLVGWLADAISKGRVFDQVRPVFNLVVSNLGNLNFKLFIGGYPVVGITPFGPIVDGAGLNITVYGYMGTLQVGLICCPETVGDLDYLLVCLQSELSELVEVAVTAIR